MYRRSVRSTFAALLLALAAVFAIQPAVLGQTYRGAISGVPTDPSGAVVFGAQVTAVATDTNSTYKTVTSSAGEFAFSNLPLGNYSVTIVASGFSPEKINNVTVSAGVVYTLPVKMSVASANQTVEVAANALTLDTVTDTLTTVLPEEVVQNLPNSGRDFT